MNRILELFTFNGGYKGGISTMIDAYLNGVEEFNGCACELDHLNVVPSIITGNNKLNNIIYLFFQRREVKKYLKNNHFDLVHIHTSREFLFLKDILLARMIRKKFNIPVVMTLHVGSIHTVFNRIKFFKRKSIILMNKYVDKILFLSEGMCKDFIDFGLKSNIAITLHNFHNFPLEHYHLRENGKLLQLLYVGAIHKEKGIIELLNALLQITDVDYHLSICGNITDKSIEEEFKNMINLLGDKVSFLGYVTGEAKINLFYNSDILILPSYHEGMPIVIMEALGAGCAIMATPVGAIPEVLGAENCIWVDIASVESIKNQLNGINEKMLQDMKLANKELGKNYSFLKHVKKLSNIYRDVIENIKV